MQPGCLSAIPESRVGNARRCIRLGGCRRAGFEFSYAGGSGGRCPSFSCKDYQSVVLWLSRTSDHRNTSSLAARLRAKRFKFFQDLLSRVPPPVRILDVGGTADFWKKLDDGYDRTKIQVVLLNVKREAIDDPLFDSLVGDARDLSSFGNQSIDIVFSNSVIEHVGNFDDQRRMAEEVRRVGKRYFIQTPNAWFPIEPHFMVPGFQFMPLEVRTLLLTRFRLGWVPRTPDRRLAEEIVSSIRLLTPLEMRRLFPEAATYRERFVGMTKSIIAYYGW
jgi:hypothetical protein